MEPFFIFRKESDQKNIIASKNGFCILALLFGPIWGLVKGLWLEGSVNILIIFITELFFSESLYLITIISLIVWGGLGRDLYIQKLLKSNYYPYGIISSTSASNAVITFLSRNK